MIEGENIAGEGGDDEIEEEDTVDMGAPFDDEPAGNEKNGRRVVKDGAKFDKNSNFFKEADADHKKTMESKERRTKLECLIGKSKIAALSAFGYRVDDADGHDVLT